MTWPKGQWNPWFQSTHSLRSATTLEVDGGFVSKVSIHALLAECDGRGADEGGRPCGFNPRTPCGVRPTTMARRTPPPWFQSTHSLRSATLQGHCRSQDFQVSIHALLAECDRWHVPHLITLLVSIHALLAECDNSLCEIPSAGQSFNPRTPCGVRLFNPLKNLLKKMFQSTHSLRSATCSVDENGRARIVSIHALLAECDPPLHLSLP